MSGSQAINEDTIVGRNKDVVHSDLEGEKVLLSVQAGKYFRMNRTASRVWDLLEEPRSVSDICDALVREYAVSYSSCLTDVSESLTGMARHGIVQIHHEPS
jgi:hypothetical protein